MSMENIAGARKPAKREDEHTVAGEHRMMRRADREVTDPERIAAIIAACYLAGAVELFRYRQATSTLQQALPAIGEAQDIDHVLDLLDGRMLLLATHDVADAQALDISDIITL